jgi:hypothetical protein
MGKLYDDEKKTKPTEIELLSPASDQVIAYSHELQRKLSMKMGKKGFKSLAISPEEVDQRAVERLCTFTASVNNLTYNGEVITADTVNKVYNDPKMGWLCDQLNERLGSWDDFLA